MTLHEQELVKKLDQQVNNLAHLVAGTEAGESQTLKEIRDLLYRLNKGMDESRPFTLDECINPSPKELPSDLFQITIYNTNTTQPPY